MEKIPENWEQPYRDWHTNRFLFQLMKTLNSPKSQEDVSEWIDKIVSNLQEFIEKRAKNIHSSPEFQKQTFEDVCAFLNSLTHNFKIKKFHNSIPKTTLKDYKNKTIWEQFIHNAYKYDWEFDTDCKGWNCSYWTISLFQFFKALKKAGLNIDIKIFRFKNMYDNFAWILSLRHSWLIINFDGKDYLCDYDGLNFVYGEWNSMIQPLDDLRDQIAIYATALAMEENQNTASSKIWKTIDVNAIDEFDNKFQEIQHSRSETYTKSLFFNSEDHFIKDVEKYPWPQRVMFYSPIPKDGEYPKIEIEFLPWGINFLTNSTNETLYALKEDAVLDPNPENFFQSLVSQLKYVKIGETIREIREEEQDYLLTNLEAIKNDLNLSLLVKRCEREEKEITKRRAGIIPALWNLLKKVKERYKSLVH